MLAIDLTGKRAFVAGVADDGGFGFAIAKSLAMAGASVCVGTWPPAFEIFQMLLSRGKMDAAMTMPSGQKFSFEKIYPLDAAYDSLEDIPQTVRDDRRYKKHADVSIAGVAKALQADFGEHPVDIIVHSLANGPEVKSPLLDTSRNGYLAAVGVSSYSLTSMVQKMGPITKPGGSFCALSYLAGERVIPGYGGGMSSAKAALESDVRTLAYEAGRKWGLRINCISAGPYASRAASAIGIIDKMVDYCRENSPLPEILSADEVGNTAAFLASPLASAITGETIYVDKGYHAMGMSVSALTASL